MTVPLDNNSEALLAGTPRSNLREAIEQATAVASSLDDALTHSTAELDAAKQTIAETRVGITAEFERARAEMAQELDREFEAATARADKSLDDTRDQLFNMKLAAASLEQTKLTALSAFENPDDDDDSNQLASSLSEQLSEKILDARRWCTFKSKIWPAATKDYDVLLSLDLRGDLQPTSSSKAAVPGWYVVVAESGSWARAGVELRSAEVAHLAKGQLFHACERRITNPAPNPGLARLKLTHGCRGWTSEVGCTSGQPICVPFDRDRCDAMYEVVCRYVNVRAQMDLDSEKVAQLDYGQKFEVKARVVTPEGVVRLQLSDGSGWTSLNGRGDEGGAQLACWVSKRSTVTLRAEMSLEISNLRFEAELRSREEEATTLFRQLAFKFALPQWREQAYIHKTASVRMEAAGWSMSIWVLSRGLNQWRKRSGKRASAADSVGAAGQLWCMDSVTRVVRSWRRVSAQVCKARRELKIGCERYSSRSLRGGWRHMRLQTRKQCTEDSSVTQAVKCYANCQVNAALSLWVRERRLVHGLRGRTCNYVHVYTLRQLQGWADRTKEQRDAIKALKKAGEVGDRRFTQVGVGLWQQQISGMIAAQKATKAAVKWRQGRTKCSALAVWREQATACRAQMQKMRHALMRILKAKLAAAFTTWRSMADDQREQKSKVQAALKRMMQRELCAALDNWREMVNGENSKIDKMRRALMRILKAKLAAALATWRSMADDQREQQSKVQAALKRMMQRELHNAWDNWRELVSFCRANLGKMRKAILNLLNAKLAAAFRTWQAVASDQSEQQQKVGAALKRMMQRMLCAALTDWRELVNSDHSKLKKMKWALARILNSKLAAAFATWKEIASYLSEQQSKVQAALKRMMQRELHNAWDNWRELVSFCRANLGKMRKAILNLLNAKLAAAFRTWQAVASDQSEQQEKVKAALERMMQRELCAALADWREKFHDNNEQSQKVRKALSRLLNAKLAAAFRTWQIIASDQSAQQKTIRGALKRMMQRGLCAAWSTWRENSSKARDHRWLIKQALNRMLKRHLCDSLALWREQVATHRSVHRKLSIALSRMLKSRLLYAWNMWRACKSTGSRARKALNKLLHREQTRAFNFWRDQAHQASSQQLRVSKALKKLFKRELNAAWNTWLSATRDDKSKRDKLKKALHRLTHQKLHSSFTFWHDKSSTEGDVGRKLRAAASRMVKRHLNAAWNSLLDHARESRAVKDKLRKALYKMTHMKVNGGFRWWCDEAHRMKNTKRKLAIALYRLLKRAMSGAWRLWHDHKVFSDKCNHVLLRWTNTKLHSSFTFWHDKSCSQKNVQRKLRAAASRMVKRHLNAAWNSLLDHARESRAVKDKLRKALYKMTHMKVNGGFRWWCDEAHRMKNTKRTLAIALNRMLKRAMLVALTSWQVDARQSKKEYDKIYFVIDRLERKNLRESFDLWDEQSLSCKDSARKLRGALTRLLKQQLSAAWSMLCSYTRESKQMKEKLQKALSRVMHKRLVAAFHWWCDAMQRSRNSSWKVRACLNKMTKRKLVASWKGWLVVVQRARRNAAHIATSQKLIQRNRAQHLITMLRQRVSAFKSLQSGLGMLEQQQLNEGWNAWSEAALVWHLTKLRGSRAIARLKQIGAARAFDILQTKLQERTTRVARVEWMGRRLEKRNKSLHFHTWVYGCQTVRELAHKKTQAHNRTQHAINWLQLCRQRWTIQDMRKTAALRSGLKRAMMRAASFENKSSRSTSMHGWLKRSKEMVQRRSSSQLGKMYRDRTARRTYLQSWALGCKARMSKHTWRDAAIHFFEDRHQAAVMKLWGKVLRAGIRKEKKLRSERGMALVIAETQKVTHMTRLRAWRHLNMCAHSWKASLFKSIKAVDHSIRFKRNTVMQHWLDRQAYHGANKRRSNKATKYRLQQTRQTAIMIWSVWLQRVKGRLTLNERAVDGYITAAKTRGLCDFAKLTRSRLTFAQARPIGVRADCIRLFRKLRHWSRLALAHSVKSMDTATRKYNYFAKCHAAVSFWQWRASAADRLATRDRVAAAIVMLSKQKRAITFWGWRALAADYRATEIYFIK